MLALFSMGGGPPQVSYSLICAKLRREGRVGDGGAVGSVVGVGVGCAWTVEVGAWLQGVEGDVMAVGAVMRAIGRVWLVLLIGVNGVG